MSDRDQESRDRIRKGLSVLLGVNEEDVDSRDVERFVGKDGPPVETKTRLNLELTTKTRDRLLGLKTKSGAGSMTEVVRKALAVYEVIVDHRLRGDEIILRSTDGYEKTLVV